MRAIRSGSRPFELLLIGGGLLACSGSGTAVPATTLQPNSPPAIAVPEVFPVAPGAERFGRVFSPRMQLSIPLPDADNWQLKRERKSSFLVLEHAATNSRLVIRVWREPERMNRLRCEERARLIRDLPHGTDVTSAAIDAPSGFDTHVSIGFEALGPQGRVTGHAIAFGSRRARCFAYAYTTTATGPDAERTVGDRLAIMEGRSLADLELRSDTTPDIAR